MKVSYFETGRYVPPPDMAREWPVPAEAYDPDTGVEAFRGMVERVKFVASLGFDWVSVSEHHYSPRILTPSPVISAAWLAARVDTIKIALLGPIVPVSNPIRIAEELAMLDTLAPGRIVVGLLRGTTNEYLSYDLNPMEARERTDEGMELILKAWAEPQPFGWQGRHFQYRTVSIWPRPIHQPHPLTYALGTSAEAGNFAARHRIGLGVSYGTFELMAKATAHYRGQCTQHGWQPGPDDIIYRANMILGETDDTAEKALHRRDRQAAFPVRATLRDALLAADARNVGGEARPANVGRVLPISFCGGPDRIVEQIRRCREQIGAGVLDLSLQDPGAGDTDAMLSALELFGRKVLPRIQEI
jgi:alkanesulfonate monooxygenase SsuD/methylene tetrahydromethanopterin reductase-like flavin-dependent oxidoreductase (luciferase family)